MDSEVAPEGWEFELTAHELASEAKEGWRLKGLPAAYEPVPPKDGRWPHITRVEVSRDHLGTRMVSIEVEDRLGWLIRPEEAVRVIAPRGVGEGVPDTMPDLIWLLMAGFSVNISPVSHTKLNVFHLMLIDVHFDERVQSCPDWRGEDPAALLAEARAWVQVRGYGPAVEESS